MQVPKLKGQVKKRPYFHSHPWRGFVAGSYRDFDTQEEAFRWAEKKVIDFRLRHPNYAHYWGTK